MSAELRIPVTEQSNKITDNIDVAPAEDIPKLLCKCDQEIFNGWSDYPSISSSETSDVIHRIIGLVVEVFKNPDDNGIVLSGCGTSGRLAFFIARAFNAALQQVNKPRCCEYLIAGGDVALLTSQEAPEDCPTVGKKDLLQVCSKHKWKEVLFIGITCGLSAPYVAGQLDHCMQHLDIFTPILLGFNPIEMSRDNQIEGWDKTFRQTARQMQHLQTEGKNVFVLNPVVGPEAITGSSRMKGGSATKILLEIILWTSLVQASRLESTEGSLSIAALINMYQRVLDMVKQNSTVSTECIKLAGKSLNTGGHVYYIGTDQLGILGIIDASECPPTYGATLEDIRGFIQGGFNVYGNNEGDMSHLGEAFKIGTDHFVQNILPRLRDCDTVIFLLCQSNDDISRLASSVKHQYPAVTTVGLHFIHPVSELNQDAIIDNVFHYSAKILLPWDDLLHDLGSAGITSWSQPHALQAAQFAIEMAAKWTLNSISTGAHILKGKVYKNFMVDLKLSNSKLFNRGISIVQRFTRCTHEVARLAILKAIYDTDDITSDVEGAPVSKHNYVAADRDKVIPTALLLVLQGCSVEDAKLNLHNAPVIREAIAQLCDGH